MANQIRSATGVIDQSINQRGVQLKALDTLFSSAEKVQKLSDPQIALHNESLAKMLDATKADIGVLANFIKKIESDLGIVESPLIVGDERSLEEARAKNRRTLEDLLPVVRAAGKKAGILHDKIKIVQGKADAGNVPDAGVLCGLLSKKNAWRAA